MKLVKSFSFAWQGLKYCFLTQQNFRIHLIALLMVIMLGGILKINHIEWLIIIGCAMLVLSMELLNTAIEKVCDLPALKIAARPPSTPKVGCHRCNASAATSR